ncbi:UNVERIFIED_CONTAM: hypothetical protein Slati_0425800 [Sesamum latifolium]|uniref:Integrase zinc-binding domain-containing protein n=1 Tax=Sesamum latifolium TaxID=2727402 RepID=A0AAW2XW28_9LAMI
MEGKYEVKEERMKNYLQQIKGLTDRLNDFQLHQIPRTENAKADYLAKLASSMTNCSTRNITVRTLTKNPSEHSIMTIHGETDWRKPLLNYLEKDVLPPDEKEPSRLKHRAAKFAVLNGILYKCSFSHPFLRCLSREESRDILQEIRGRLRFSYSRMDFSHKALRAGYFWPTLKKDAISWARGCKQCQQHAPLIHIPVESLRALSSPCHFSQLGIDIVGPFPVAARQRKFLLVAVDYFSKWIQAEPLARITENEVIKFLWKNIICRYGLPPHPQANGQVEVINRILVQGIKTKLAQAKDQWVDALPGVLWSYRTTARSITGETPFSLVYGSDDVIPTEAKLESFRIQHYEPENNDHLMRASLDLIEELREDAQSHMERYKQRIMAAYNRRVKKREFQVGDFVLRRAGATGPVGKLSPNWEGPFGVSRVTKFGAYELEDSDGRKLSRPWNICNLKKFFI